MYQCGEARFDLSSKSENPRVETLLKNSHIRRLVFSEEAATAEKLAVHVILGTADIQRIKSCRACSS